MAEGDKKTVFIVEDDIFLIKAYQIKFGNEGFNVMVAADGKEALSYLDKEPADIVLLDLMLPGMSGFDVLQAIRSNPKWSKVPVIILSNLGQQQDIDKGKALGANDYIIKTNIKISDIVGKVREYIK